MTDEEQQTLEYYNNHAEEWAERRRKRTEPSFWKEEIDEFKSLKNPQGKILELGSGAGREAVELIGIGYNYTGIDVSRELIKIAQSANPMSEFFLSTAYHLPFESATFDAFFSWAMLPHIPKQRLGIALCSLKRVLKPDAIGFIAMREGGGFLQEKETGRWFSYYNQEEFEKILQDHGFKIQKKNRKFSRPGLVWLTFFVLADAY